MATQTNHDHSRSEEMKAQGFGGALRRCHGAARTAIDPCPPGRFGRRTDCALCPRIERGRPSCLEISLNIMSGWNLGGPTVRPEDASKILTSSRVVVQGGKPLDIEIPQPSSREGFYREIALLAYPLHHGRGFAPQLNDRQGDHHTAEEHADEINRLRGLARVTRPQQRGPRRRTPFHARYGTFNRLKNDPVYPMCLSEVRSLTSSRTVARTLTSLAR